MDPTRNPLPEDVRLRVSRLLQVRLADLINLYLQVKTAHWNVKGPSFYSTHKLLDKLAQGVEDNADTVAERIVGLGEVAEGTLTDVRRRSSLAEFPLGLRQDVSVIGTIADRFASVAEAVKATMKTADELQDWVSFDILTDVARNLDQGIYLLESHLPRT